ncbi:MAG: hypothetical protein ACI4EA_02425, partial [Candidatus Ornithomonoglobus sp.]
MKRIHSAVIAAAIITSLLPINAFAAAEITADADADSNGIKFDISSTDVNDVLTTFDISAGGGSLTVDLKEKLNPENIGSWSGSSIFKAGIKVKDVVGAGADAGDMDFSVGDKSYNLYNDYVGDKGTAEVKNDTFAQTICKDVGVSGTFENGQFTRTDSNPMYSTYYNEATGVLWVSDVVSGTTAEDVKLTVNGGTVDDSEKAVAYDSVNVTLNQNPGLLLEEDFTDVTDTWDFTTTGGVAVVTADTNKYLQLESKNGSKATDVKTLDAVIASQKLLNVSFKWKTEADFTSASGRQSVFELKDSEGNIIFCLSGSANRPADYPPKVRYAVNDRVSNATTTGTALSDSNDWFTVSLQLDFINKKLSGSITDAAGKIFTIDKTSINAQNLAVLSASNVSSVAPMDIDDISITRGESQAAVFTVLSSKDNTPVADAVVDVNNVTCTTNANGKAVLNLPAGTYEATVTASEHRIGTTNITVSNEDIFVPVTLEYVGVTNPQSIVISGGDDGIYKPASGENKTVNPYTAVVYDNVGQAMPAEEIEWSIDNIKTGLTGVSIENGIVTVTSDMPIVDNNGDELIIRATCKSDTTVTSTVTLHVYNVAEISDFDITGPAVIKDG